MAKREDWHPADENQTEVIGEYMLVHAAMNEISILAVTQGEDSLIKTLPLPELGQIIGDVLIKMTRNLNDI